MSSESENSIQIHRGNNVIYHVYVLYVEKVLYKKSLYITCCLISIQLSLASDQQLDPSLDSIVLTYFKLTIAV